MKALTCLAIGVWLTVIPAIGAAQSSAPTIEQKTKAAAEKTGAYAKDAWVTSKTKIALYADERVSANEVKVETKSGAVTLRGKVATDAEKRAAEEVARGVDGVTSVKNQLQVVPASARKAVDAKDDDLTTTVKARINREARLKGSAIQVRADNGVVTLTGDVTDIGARARASEVARGVPGVKAVKNELKEKS